MKRGPGRSGPRTIDWGVVATLGVVAVVFWAYRLVAPATKQLHYLQNADFFLQIYPMAYRAADWIRSGILPLWNPYQFAGHPFLATGIHGVLYPLNAWHLLLPTAAALEAVLVTHVFAAGAFTYAYARTLHLDFTSAATAAVTYMLSGFIARQALFFPPALAAAVWLPLMLLAFEKISAGGRPTWCVVLAIAVAAPVLAGWPQTWLYSLYAFGAYAVVRGLAMLVSGRRPDLTRVVLLSVVGLIGGFGLAAVQLLPTLELQNLGPRQAGGLSPLQLLTLPPSGMALAADMTNPTAGMPRPAYLGTIWLALLVLALRLPRHHRTTIAYCILLVVFALGVILQTPLYHLYVALPGVPLFRLPPRIVFLHAFGGAMLAGIGIHAVGSTHDRRANRIALVIAAAVILAAAPWMLGLELPSLARWYGAIAILALLIAAISDGRSRRMALAVIPCLLAVDLGHAVRNDYKHPIHGTAVFDREKAIFDYVHRHQGLDRLYIEPPELRGQLTSEQTALAIPAMEKQGTLREIFSITDYEPLSLNRYREFYQLLEAPADRTSAQLTFTGRMKADPSRPEFRLLDVLSVRFMATPGYDGRRLDAMANRSNEWRPVSVPFGGSYLLFERIDVLPRAYVAHTAVRAADGPDALRALTDGTFDPHRTVVLEGDYAEHSVPALITEAHITSYTPRSVVIHVDTPAAGYLVLTDTFFPGWQARVDGESRPILRANYLVRAVAVDAGPHEVTFTYAPASFRLGLAVTLLTMLALTVVVFASSAMWTRNGGEGTEA